MGTCVSKCCSVTAEPLPPPSAETKCRTGANSRPKLDQHKLVVVVPRSQPHSYSSQSTTSSSSSSSSNTSTSSASTTSTCSSCSSSSKSTRLYSDKFFEGPRPRSSPVLQALKPRHPNRPAPAPRSTREGSGLPVTTPPAGPALRSPNSSSAVKVRDCSTLVDNIDNPLISMECFIFI